MVEQNSFELVTHEPCMHEQVHAIPLPFNPVFQPCCQLETAIPLKTRRTRIEVKQSATTLCITKPHFQVPPSPPQPVCIGDLLLRDQGLSVAHVASQMIPRKPTRIEVKPSDKEEVRVSSKVLSGITAVCSAAGQQPEQLLLLVTAAS